LFLEFRNGRHEAFFNGHRDTIPSIQEGSVAAPEAKLPELFCIKKGLNVSFFGRHAGDPLLKGGRKSFLDPSEKGETSHPL